MPEFACTMPTPFALPTRRRRRTFDVRVLRQDGPGQPSYWERHRVEYEPDMNCISVLQQIAAKADDRRRPARRAGGLGLQLPGRGLRRLHDAHQRPRAPGLHGAGRPAAATIGPSEIELRPMTKFPVIRDLMVDRSRMFAMLEKIQAWVPVDSYLRPGPGAAAVAGDSSRWPISQQVHDLRLLPGGLPAVSEDRAGPASRARRDEAVRRPAARGEHAGVHRRARHRPGRTVQHEPDRRDELAASGSTP